MSLARLFFFLLLNESAFAAFSRVALVSNGGYCWFGFSFFRQEKGYTDKAIIKNIELNNANKIWIKLHSSLTNVSVFLFCFYIVMRHCAGKFTKNSSFLLRDDLLSHHFLHLVDITNADTIRRCCCDAMRLGERTKKNIGSGKDKRKDFSLWCSVEALDRHRLYSSQNVAHSLPFDERKKKSQIHSLTTPC